MTATRQVQFLSVFLLPALLLGCASAPRGRVANAVDRGDVSGALSAYATFRETEGHDRALLGRVAALLLAQEAEGDDEERRSAALLQLQLAGTAGEPVLWELARTEGFSASRLGALSILASRQREEAVLALRALADHREQRVRAASVLGMDPELDRALLLEFTAADDASLRRTAVLRLVAVANNETVRDRLRELARDEPESRVRAAAVRALGHGGEAAIAALRERLADPASSVRLAAVSALLRADPQAGSRAVASLLEVAPSPAGVEAARLIAQTGGSTDDASSLSANAAIIFLLRALENQDASLRAQAGVALSSLPSNDDQQNGPEWLNALVRALREERDPTVRLAIARALHRQRPQDALMALTQLCASPEAMARVQAARILAEADREVGIEALRRALDEEDESLVRRTAARALTRRSDGAQEASALMTDRDPLVRISAAGGLLAPDSRRR